MHKKRLQRLQYIADYLKTGHTPTFVELQEIIAHKFAPIKERMLRDDLSVLREQGTHGVPLNIKEKHNRYFYSNDFAFNANGLDHYETATLPFLFGLLEPYKHLASVSALLTTLIKTHKLNQHDINSSSFVFQVTEPPANPKWIHALNEIFLAIYNQNAIEFFYRKVTNGGLHDEDLHEYVVLFPLQVRYFQGLYYVIGVKAGVPARPENVRLFRINQIHRGPDVYLDEETELPLLFDWEKYYRNTELETYYKDCIGLLRNYHVHRQPKKIYRWFRGWAASLVLAQPLHASQRLIETAPNGDIKIELVVYETEELEGVFSRFGQDSWPDIASMQ